MCIVALALMPVRARCADDAPITQEMAAVLERNRTEVADFVAKQEQLLNERVKAESTPLRQLQMEFLQRQDIAVRMEEELRRAVMTEAFTSPEVERLRAERQALQERLETLRQDLIKAGYETVGAQEMRAAIATNKTRLVALRAILWPKTGGTPKPLDENDREDDRKAE